MENDQKTDKNRQKHAKMSKEEQIGTLLYAFNILKARRAVRNQKDFAALLGVSEQTISYAFAGRGRSLNDTFVNRVAEYMQNDYGIDVFGPSAQIFITGESVAAPSAPADSSIKVNDANVAELLKQLKEKDEQINRLLTLLENEQKKHL